MIDKKIIINQNGIEIIGKIIELDEHFIKIEIISPYCNWTNQSKSNGMSRLSPNNFLNRYEEVSKRLLLDSYNKIKIIDENIERICNVFDMLNEELNEAEKLDASKTKERIISKLQDWFFKDFIFTSSVTNLVPSIDERKKILDFIVSYKFGKNKDFLKK